MKTALKVATSVGIAIVCFIVVGLITWFIMTYPNIGIPIMSVIVGIAMLIGLASITYITFFYDVKQKLCRSGIIFL